MINGFVRVAAVTPRVSVGNPAANADYIEKVVREAAGLGARVIVAPELSLTGYTCGELFLQDTLLDAADAALKRLVENSEGRDEIVIVGLPFRHHGKLYNVAAVYSDGQLHGLVPKTHLPNYGEYYELRHFITPTTETRHNGDGSFCVTLPGQSQMTTQTEPSPLCPFGTDILFTCTGDIDFKFAVEICEDLWASEAPSARHAKSGAVIIANLSASDETIGKADYRRLLARAQSGKLLCGYIYANAGFGESTTDMTFSGHSIIAENGAILAESKPFSRNEITITEIDVRGLERDRRYMNTFEAETQRGRSFLCHSSGTIPKDNTKRTVPSVSAADSSRAAAPEMYRRIDAHPFVPSDAAKRRERCEEILAIQTDGLATRLIHARAKSAVVGISGGLDSTLALLACVRAAKIAGLPKDAIIAVTMPSFGTTTRTKNNAYGLGEALETEVREIAVTDTVRAHLASINHDESVHDVVFENAQARVRTLTLMDIANAANGIVVGTGDLSELALGWATYNGDHMSMYGVNAGVPKTLVRHIIGYAADEAAENGNPKLARVLMDILDTPVSPELLPPEDGDISQKTEEIIGPYELHDFFLYHMVRFGRKPRVIFDLAKIAFAGAYNDKIIRDWLLVFTKRFFANQFKRSALPDGPKVGSVTLSPRGDWRMPSDADADAWITEIENIETQII
jgi:NAD+ synthase (glutamine-hydrolysing)